MTAGTAAPGNVAAHLPRVARAQPDRLAVAIAGADGSYRRLTAAELDRLCDRAAWALQAIGIGAGTRTVLMVTPGPEFFALTFALFKLGAVPVMVDPGMGIRNLGACLDDAEPTAFLGVPKAQWARRMFGWGRGRITASVSVGRSFCPGDRRFDQLLAASPDREFPTQEPTPGQVAAILFTSGSTGTPKGVVYTHATFNAQVELLRQVYGIAPGEVDLSTFPLFALFGPALGMASVVPYMDASRPGASDPRRLVTAIQDFQCTNVFASPALVDLLGRYCERRDIQLPSVRRVLSAGAPAAPRALQRLARALPADTEIFTPYGATEALPVSSIGSAEILGETRVATDAGGGVCVGRPVPGVDVAIIPIDEAPIDTWSEDLRQPTDTIGEIVVAGPVVTPAYFRRPAATRLAKIRDGATVRHRMGDVGYLDQRGRLWMCGRKAHRVTTDAATLFTIPCEAVFNTHPAVRRTALVGVSRGGHPVPVLCVELEAGQRRSAALTRELLELGAAHDHTRAIRTVLYHRRFPVDVRHNAKIFREQLAVWADRQLPPVREPSPTATESGGRSCASS